MNRKKDFEQKSFQDIELPPKDALEVQKMFFPRTPAKIIFDLGASVGWMTSRYRRCFPEATIYAFEPFRESFETLCTKFQSDEQVKPFNLAVSSKAGREYLYCNRRPGTNSLYATADNIDRYVDPAAIKNVGKAKVPVMTIDTFCHQHCIDEIDILKMDIQGNELEALKGAKDKLSQQKITMIYAEIWFLKVYQKQPLFHHLYRFLDDCGYALIDLLNFVYTPEGQLKWGDAIFANTLLAENIGS